MSRRTRLCLLLLAALGLWLRYSPKARRGNDFRVYHTAARAALQGEDPYGAVTPDGRRYLYPPALAALVAPLARLPHDTAASLWIALEGTAFLAAVALLAGRLGWGPALAGLLCIARPADSDLGNGQVNLLVTLLLVAGSLALARGRALPGGAAFGAAAALKVTPALFVLWLLVRRSPRALCAAIASAAVLLCLFPALLWGGPGRAWAANRTWADRFLLPAVTPGRPPPPGLSGARPDYVPGHSLRALLHRRLGRSSAEGSLRRPPRYVNWANLPPATVAWLYRGAALLVLVLSLSVSLRRARGGETLRALALLFPAMLLAAPVTRKAHLVALLLPAAVLAKEAWGRPGRLGLLLLAALLLNATAPGLFGRPFSRWALAHGALTGGVLLFWVLLLLAPPGGAPAGRSGAAPEAAARGVPPPAAG